MTLPSSRIANRIAKIRIALIAASLAACGVASAADDTIKVGVIGEFSGAFAQLGHQMENGIKTYVKEHGDTVGGKKIVLIMKDSGGPHPEVAKRLAQELVTRDHVDFLAGFSLTPNGLAAASVADAAKKPMIIMNAATSIITTKSPYIARVSMTLPQVSAPMGKWAVKNGIKSVATLVADYGPGIDSEGAFTKSFTEGGGRIVDSARVPLQNPEFAPFIQRMKDAKPQAVFVFLPAGGQSVAFMKAFHERGLAKAGIKLIGTGDLTDDTLLDVIGDATLGVITTFHYSAAHDSPENKAYVKRYAEVNGTAVPPNFVSVAGYDGMAAIYDVVKKLKGNIDGDKAMEVLKGWKTTSPRGPLLIDPKTRDPVQTVYVRRVEKVNGHLYNVEFDRFPEFRDPTK
jgi:branched-chain amino acid transport system substrate-binding protein